MAQKTKVVVITGATAGVGRATAQAFAKRGAHLGLLARDKKRLEATENEVEKLGGKAIGISVDVANAKAIEKAAQTVEKKFGPIDVWINNAMTSVFSPAKSMLPEEYEQVTKVTYLGYVYGTITALKSMLKRNKGVIIQVGSALAYRGIPLQSAYCASKHAIQGFTESVRTELIHDNSNVHITMVQMPALNTPQFEWVKSRLPNKAQPVPPIFQPEVAAQAIVWASENRRRELRVGLSSELSIQANKFFPGFLDNYLAKSAYKSQQTPEKADPNRPSNLYEAVPGNFSAHGRFDKRASYSSNHLWIATHLGEHYLAIVLGTALILVLLILISLARIII